MCASEVVYSQPMSKLHCPGAMRKRIQILPFKSVLNLPFRVLGRCCFDLNFVTVFGDEF